MSDLIRDSTLGQIINRLSSGKYLPYKDQLSTYVIPQKYLKPSNESAIQSSSSTLCGDVSPNKFGSSTPIKSADLSLPLGSSSPSSGIEHELEKGDKKLEAIRNATEGEGEVVEAPYAYLVEFEEFDSDNPRDWSQRKRIFVGFEIALLTFSVYVGSAIYTSSIPSLITSFNIDQTTATWGLTLFVLAYGIGPMFLAPLQEMASIGRTPVYIIGLFLFVLFQVPPIFAKNIGTILVFRFLAGFVGSPALATGGASMGDIFPPSAQPYAIGAWSIGAVCGPVAGPIIGNFAAQANGWRWPFYELLWISAFALIVLTILLPETLGTSILLRRAQRLRKLTGNDLLRTREELDVTEGVVEQAWINFVRAIQLSAEPAILFANVYIALVYAIFYTFFESFPIVFSGIYGFNLGLSGLPFVGFFVTGAITFTLYVLYNKYHMVPRMDNDPDLQPEARLELAIVASCFIPISMFIFGWGSRPEVHWIVPVIGAALYLPGIFLIFQCILIYITMGYPKYAASLLAGNDLFRSSFASFFPLFGAALFTRLGLGGGSSLLAGLSIILIPVLYALMKYGGRLRARSKWTDNN